MRAAPSGLSNKALHGPTQPKASAAKDAWAQRKNAEDLYEMRFSLDKNDKWRPAAANRNVQMRSWMPTANAQNMRYLHISETGNADQY
jgi:hypothetical protein